MNHLIIYAHPNNESFCHAIKEITVNTLTSLGHEVKIRDLYDMNFDPVLSPEDLTSFKNGGSLPSDIQTEQEHVKWADVMTFIYPIWWTGLPAIAKGYIDRVYSYGFAYAPDGEGGYKKLLSGKRGVIINTQGNDEDYYEKIGMKDAMLQTSDEGILNFCGVEVVDHLFFGSVPFINNEKRKTMLDQVQENLIRYFEK
ncbi:NAD(P)H-dependent oxidoreductase [Bacillus sp. 2205SS5-2]|uniref:NAD(P)H-dependent oxidoreductase n=1 Tax=Bacillus sp. 2205SS5-2 TaxID=3109031 RepID=UPI003007C741